jgi:polar amino acid transport system substrate-binding protein
MRRVLIVVAAAGVVAAAAGCGSSGSSSPGATSGATPPALTTRVGSCSKGDLSNALVSAGHLTVGTDNPAYPPWFGGTPPKGSKWQVSYPPSGKGFESAVAYAVAKQLGFPHAQVVWTYEPFNKSFAPGKKDFDFDVNEISYTPERAKVVAFSDSYYDVNQAVVVKKGTPIAKVTSVAGLKPYKLGAQLGTTSYQFITSEIKPSKQPAVFPQNAGAVQALKNGQIDGLVVDLPTAFYVTAVQVPNSKILGQFPTQPGGEHFGLVFQKGSKLVACVNRALTKLRSGGQLKQLQQQWLAKATGAPTLK